MKMLASFRDYLFVWQLPLLATFLVGWTAGGGFLLRRSIRRRGLRRPIGLGHCVLASFLAGVAGAVSAGAILLLAIRVGKALDVSVMVPAIALAALALLVVSLLVLYAMFEFPAHSLVAAAALPLGATIVLGLLIAAAAGAPAYYLRQQQIKREFCLRNLVYVHGAVAAYFEAHGDPPEELNDLVNEKYLPPRYLTCAAVPHAEEGYFYLAARPITPDRPTGKLLACDFRGRHTNGRAVVFVNGVSEWLSEEGFQALLSHAANAAFAKTLAEAEGR